jgi:beta-mannosidase
VEPDRPGDHQLLEAEGEAVDRVRRHRPDDHRAGVSTIWKVATCVVTPGTRVATRPVPDQRGRDRLRLPLLLPGRRHPRLERGLARHFQLPDGDFDRWHYLTQVNQARAVAAGIEHWRSHWPVCAGTILWQLNDCWPVTSWAAVDGDGRAKPLHHELRRLYADRLLTLQPRGGELVLAAVNQSSQAWRGALTLRRMSVEGLTVGEATVGLSAAARTVAEVRVPRDLEPVGPKEFLVADADGLRALHFPAPDREIPYPVPEFEVKLTPGAVTVTAHTLVQDLLLQADRLDPAVEADTGLVTLLPGEQVTIGVRGWETPDVETARSALYCVEPAL